MKNKINFGADPAAEPPRGGSVAAEPDARFEHQDRVRSDRQLLADLLHFAAPGHEAALCDDLLSEFGDAASALSASRDRLLRSCPKQPEVPRLFSLVQCGSEALARADLERGPVLSGNAALVRYCRVSMARLEREQVRLLLLDCDNTLIGEEIMADGTLDRAPIYAREAARAALRANAAACILVHNHPGVDATPSPSDIAATRKVAKALKLIDVELHDHLIISAARHVSLRDVGVLPA